MKSVTCCCQMMTGVMLLSLLLRSMSNILVNCRFHYPAFHYDYQKLIGMWGYLPEPLELEYTAGLFNENLCSSGNRDMFITFSIIYDRNMIRKLANSVDVGYENETVCLPPEGIEWSLDNVIDVSQHLKFHFRHLDQFRKWILGKVTKSRRAILEKKHHPVDVVLWTSSLKYNPNLNKNVYVRPFEVERRSSSWNTGRLNLTGKAERAVLWDLEEAYERLVDRAAHIIGRALYVPVDDRGFICDAQGNTYSVEGDHQCIIGENIAVNFNDIEEIRFDIWSYCSVKHGGENDFARHWSRQMLVTLRDINVPADLQISVCGNAIWERDHICEICCKKNRFLKSCLQECAQDLCCSDKCIMMFGEGIDDSKNNTQQYCRWRAVATNSRLERVKCKKHSRLFKNQGFYQFDFISAIQTWNWSTYLWESPRCPVIKPFAHNVPCFPVTQVETGAIIPWKEDYVCDVYQQCVHRNFHETRAVKFDYTAGYGHKGIIEILSEASTGSNRWINRDVVQAVKVVIVILEVFILILFIFLIRQFVIRKKEQQQMVLRGKQE